MMNSGQRLSWVIGFTITLILGTSGCASKKYVSQQINQVNSKISTYQAQTNDKIAYLNKKQDSDMANIGSRIDGTNQKLADLASSVDQAQNKADQAMAAANEANSSNYAARMEVVTRPANYQVSDKADVLFGFNKSNLTPTAMTALDEIATKFQSTPGAIVELAGFTDPIGSANYNLELSRRRAWAVQRYLVDHKVPVRSINVVGMGKGTVPQGFEAESTPIASKAARDRAARRVSIRLCEPSGTGSESQQ